MNAKALSKSNALQRQLPKDASGQTVPNNFPIPLDDSIERACGLGAVVRCSRMGQAKLQSTRDTESVSMLSPRSRSLSGFASLELALLSCISPDSWIFVFTEVHGPCATSGIVDALEPRYGSVLCHLLIFDLVPSSQPSRSILAAAGPRWVHLLEIHGLAVFSAGSLETDM